MEKVEKLKTNKNAINEVPQVEVEPKALSDDSNAKEIFRQF